MIEQLYLLSTLVLGLFAGSLLTEAMILVPYWRRMPAQEFFRLHSSLGPKLFLFFAPLTSLAVAMAVLVAFMDGGESTPWLVSAALSLIALGIFFAYFRTANNRFAKHDIAEHELAAELQKWSRWHWLRTGLIIIAFSASIHGHSL